MLSTWPTGTRRPGHLYERSIVNSIPVPNPPTAAWLTALLRAADKLQSGAFNSQTSYLRVTYSADASPALPSRFVLKQNGADAWSMAAGAEEVRFYNLVATLPDHPSIIVPCYATAYDESSGRSFLLLQDLSDTHAPPVTRDQQIAIVDGVPAAPAIDAVIDTLAQLHAYWWQHPLLASTTFDVGYWTRNADRFAQYLQRRRTAWEKLLTQEGKWFPAELRALYEELFAQLPHHWAHYLEPRFRANRGLTLVHGDAYFANFLTPKVGAAGSAYLLDWQSPCADLGSYDLANLCAAFWTPAQRQDNDRELRMLQRYHAGLCTHGVNDYAWEALLTDYKSGLIFWLLMPVQDGGDGAAKSYWWPKMQCLVAAFRDWHCETLFR
jgi:hypothetical protein